MPENPKPVALITGASAGIGAAFAHELAARGYHLVLTARRTSRLQELSEKLQHAHDIDVHILADDLADPMTPRRLCDSLAQRNLTVDLLVNNAGYGVPGRFDSSCWATHSDFIQVLIHAPTELAHRLLPGMLERGHGGMLNIASLAGHLPGSTGHTLYAAAKAYMIRFSQSLALENRDRGVQVCALCPGFTYSEFHDVTGTREKVSKMPNWMWMQADTVVCQGLDALERGEVVYVNGRINRAIKALAKLVPDRLALRLSDRHSRHYRSMQ